ncbi:MAG: HTTM domain-containing protein [Opitutaceae bacterium]
MKALVRQADAFWFQTMPARRLALLRIAIGVFALFHVLDRFAMYVAVGWTQEPLFEPAGVARFLEGPLPGHVFEYIVIATVAANVAFLFGWAHRVSGPLFALLLLITLCYRNSWSTIYHTDNLLVLHIFVLGLAPSADAWSVDAWRARSGKNRPVADWRHGWPVKLMSAATVASYFLAGVAKVAGPLGWGWAAGESLRAQIAVDGLRKSVLGAEPGAFALPFEAVPLFACLGVFTLVVELGAPLAMCGRWPARAWVAGALGMHWGIQMVMGIRFPYPACGVAFLPFFACEQIVDQGARFVRNRLRPVVTSYAGSPLSGRSLPPRESA